MKVCYIPSYEPNYSRIKIIRDGMEKNGIEVVECSSRIKPVLFRYIDLFFKFLRNKSDCDIIFVGFFGQPLVPFVRLFTRKKIVLDAFMSSYNTMVYDKKTVKPNTLKSKFLFYLDKYACKKSDLVFLDTNQHIKYFCKTFNLKQKLFRKLLVGADNEIYYPRDVPADKKFTAVFPGRFIPLQGVSYIIEAAEYLQKEDIDLRVIGDGQMKDEMVELAKKLKLSNIKFIDFMSEKDLPNWLAKSHIGLGIFGNTEKTNLVIPNKAYQFLAIGLPLITADTPAIRELLQDRKDVLLCPSANPKALAEAIIELKNNSKLREKIAKEGLKLFKEKCTPQVIGIEVKKHLNNLIG